MTAKHREALAWIKTEFGCKDAPSARPELVATYEQRRALAQEIRQAVEPLEETPRGEALRGRALLIELEPSPEAAAELLGEAEALGIEVLA